jgi:hypothetical protein
VREKEVRLMFEDGDQAIWLCANSVEEMREILENALEMLDEKENKSHKF